MNSRGSVIPNFIDQIKKLSFDCTNPEMTRFMMSLEQSVELVVYAMRKGKQGEIFAKNHLLQLFQLAKVLKRF